MSIYQNTKDDLALILTASSGLTITTAHFDVVAVAVNTQPEIARNTKAFLRFTPAAPIQGEGIAYYNRLSIGDLLKIRNPNVAITTRAGIGVSSYSMFALLRNEFGATFTADDIEETFSETAVNNNVQILIKSKTTSAGWIGEILLILPGPALLSNAFSSTVLPGF